MPELSPQTLTILLFVANFVITALVAAFSALKKQQAATHKELQEFKLEAAKDYATNNAINDALVRLHKRLDDLFKEVHKN